MRGQTRLVTRSVREHSIRGVSSNLILCAQVAEKDEVRALDLLTEWGAEGERNFYSGEANIGPKSLLPTTGVFSEEPWASKLLVMLEGCLAFLPSKRWSFPQVIFSVTNRKNRMLSNRQFQRQPLLRASSWSYCETRIQPSQSK
eukprot:GHVT01033219.1.p1 GENE.GHVT01033219.1~~GHVT01033219.1.p1  ORF type:complete len:144 (-),score=7.01 GHVT01033219.1:1029-1460(-)